MQGACDKRGRFLDVSINHPGATSDYLAFITSELHHKLEQPGFLAPGLASFESFAKFLAKGTNLSLAPCDYSRVVPLCRWISSLNFDPYLAYRIFTTCNLWVRKPRSFYNYK